MEALVLGMIGYLENARPLEDSDFQVLRRGDGPLLGESMNFVPTVYALVCNTQEIPLQPTIGKILEQTEGEFHA